MALHLLALERQIRADLGQIGQQIVHIRLVLEVALLLRAVVILHHQMGMEPKAPYRQKPPLLIATRLNTRRTDSSAT